VPFCLFCRTELSPVVPEEEQSVSSEPKDIIPIDVPGYGTTFFFLDKTNLSLFVWTARV
jgi:hypothetical protein